MSWALGYYSELPISEIPNVLIERKQLEAWNRCLHYMREIPLSIALESQDGFFCTRIEKNWIETYQSIDGQFAIPTSGFKKLTISQ